MSQLAAVALPAASAANRTTGLMNCGVTRRRDVLRHNNDVSTQKLNVGVEAAPADDVDVAERHGVLLLALSAQHDDVVGGVERRHAARHAERLHDVDARVDNELAGLVDLA